MWWPAGPGSSRFSSWDLAPSVYVIARGVGAEGGIPRDEYPPVSPRVALFDFPPIILDLAFGTCCLVSSSGAEFVSLSLAVVPIDRSQSCSVQLACARQSQR